MTRPLPALLLAAGLALGPRGVADLIADGTAAAIEAPYR